MGIEKQQGLSLIELLVALGIFSIAILALFRSELKALHLLNTVSQLSQRSAAEFEWGREDFGHKNCDYLSTAAGQKLMHCVKPENSELSFWGAVE